MQSSSKGNQQGRVASSAPTGEKRTCRHGKMETGPSPHEPGVRCPGHAGAHIALQSVPGGKAGRPLLLEQVFSLLEIHTAAQPTHFLKTNMRAKAWRAPLLSLAPRRPAPASLVLAPSRQPHPATTLKSAFCLLRSGGAQHPIKCQFSATPSPQERDQSPRGLHHLCPAWLSTACPNTLHPSQTPHRHPPSETPFPPSQEA